MTLTEERSAPEAEMAPIAHSGARHAMIVSQLRTSGVNEPWVLAAMAGVAREDFVPEAMRDAAYIDRAIPLGNGRFLAAPLVHGKILSEAAPTATDKALLVGDADGYLAALLRPLVGSLETVDPAAVSGMTGEGGYSLIVVDGAIETLPETLGAQMAEGGRIVTGLMVRGVSRLATGCKTAGAVSLLPLAELGIPALPEFAAPKRWSF
ncbi:protein-L-isoaspartate O-methyltransferase family protein [Novosphingobium mangrovi (ex Huang et al. 2023)]|uniref:Protein-L-isoaspartate O-methyltransferase n=1 Tax=Novosphingobium mangrovi (ex Huang et al. 2023) TaxID=2976432 RepID=A0ABT2I8Z5_9SPHN|nr:protein-L-isoaspartate O-methyltransferase [Novosphingobium mangrovi (ex Huang et al. 2023)]MCT2401283.1 protein-L-isoaspartate O-methyltransferase [Novosphingobium mangrovi (ex Huang et al. 2023)]